MVTMLCTFSSAPDLKFDFILLLRKKVKARLMLQHDVLIELQHLNSTQFLLRKPRVELLLQVEVDVVNEAAADERHAADQESVRGGAIQHARRSWRRRGLMVAAVMAGTALGALAAASGGRRGRQ